MTRAVFADPEVKHFENPVKKCSALKNFFVSKGGPSPNTTTIFSIQDYFLAALYSSLAFGSSACSCSMRFSSSG